MACCAAKNYKGNIKKSLNSSIALLGLTVATGLTLTLTMHIYHRSSRNSGVERKGVKINQAGATGNIENKVKVETIIVENPDKKKWLLITYLNTFNNISIILILKIWQKYVSDYGIKTELGVDAPDLTSTVILI